MTVIARYKARSNQGKEYIIIRNQEYIHTEDNSGSENIEGLSSYTTSDGLPVKRIDAKTFQIVETGETLRKID